MNKEQKQPNTKAQFALQNVSKPFICGVDKGEGDSIAVYAVYTKDGKLHWHTFKKWKMKLWILWQKAKGVKVRVEAN